MVTSTRSLTCGDCGASISHRNPAARFCEPCAASRQRKKRLLDKYGISLAKYNEMLQAQGGACAICLRPETRGRSLAVDHNHATGAIRGLLCSSCNYSSVGEIEDFIRRTGATHVIAVLRYILSHDYQLDVSSVKVN